MLLPVASAGKHLIGNKENMWSVTRAGKYVTADKRGKTCNR